MASALETLVDDVLTPRPDARKPFSLETLVDDVLLPHTPALEPLGPEEPPRLLGSPESARSRLFPRPPPTPPVPPRFVPAPPELGRQPSLTAQAMEAAAFPSEARIGIPAIPATSPLQVPVPAAPAMGIRERRQRLAGSVMAPEPLSLKERLFKPPTLKWSAGPTAGFKQSIEGLATDLISNALGKGDALVVDRDYDPGLADQAIEAVTSFLTPATVLSFVIGNAPGVALAQSLTQGLVRKYGASAMGRVLQQVAPRVAGTAGAFGTYDAVRNTLEQAGAVQKGEQKALEPGKLAGAVWRGVTLGSFLGGVGATVANRFLRLGAEVGVLASVPPVVFEGRMPTEKDVLDAGVLVFALKGAGSLPALARRALPKPRADRTPIEQAAVDALPQEVKVGILRSAAELAQTRAKALQDQELIAFERAEAGETTDLPPAEMPPVALRTAQERALERTGGRPEPLPPTGPLIYQPELGPPAPEPISRETLPRAEEAGLRRRGMEPEPVLPPLEAKPPEERILPIRVRMAPPRPDTELASERQRAEFELLQRRADAAQAEREALEELAKARDRAEVAQEQIDTERLIGEQRDQAMRMRLTYPAQPGAAPAPPETPPEPRPVPAAPGEPVPSPIVERGAVVPPAGPEIRTEPTPAGEQAILPGTPGRAIPPTPLRREGQRPVQETPLQEAKVDEALSPRPPEDLRTTLGVTDAEWAEMLPGQRRATIEYAREEAEITPEVPATIRPTADQQAAIGRLHQLLTGETGRFDPEARLSTDTLRDLSLAGRYYLARGFQTFEQWAGRMVQQFGEKIRAYLDQVWQNLQGPERPLFSSLQRVVAAKVPESAFPVQVRNLLKEANAEEVKWSGVEDWLAQRGAGKVTRAEVLDFLRQNEVRVEEVDRGGRNLSAEEARAMIRRDENVFLRTRLGDERGPLTEEELNETLPRLDRNEGRLIAGGKGTKFDRYTLPGGENYRELLFTLPLPNEKAQGALRRFAGEMTQKYGAPFDLFHAGDADRMTAAERGQRDRLDAAAGMFAEVFRDPAHWDEPNVLAHVRFNDRTDAEGKRVLFIEELQSDWAAEGRRKGFNELSPTEQARWKELENIASQERELTPQEQAEYNALDIRYGREGKAGVPAAPFVTKTDAWVGLVLKRMLRWAAERGYDKVAWTTGAQQAERYDLSKQISRVTLTVTSGGIVTPESAPFRQGMLAAYDLSGKQVIDEFIREPTEVEKYIGKEPAERLLRQPDVPRDVPGVGGGRTRTLSGLDLKVGGEWATRLYDQMLPQFLNKYAKKWGARVGTAEIAVEPTTAHGQIRIAGAGAARIMVPALDITPAMRQSVLQEGQPLFGERGSLFIPERRERRELVDAFGRPIQPDVRPQEARPEVPDIAPEAPREAEARFATPERLERPAGTDVPRPKYAANINLDRLDTPEAVKQEILGVARAYAPEIEQQRRGRMPDELLKELADDLGTTEAKVRGAAPGTAWNAESLLAARQLLVRSSEHLYGLHEEAFRTASPEALARFAESLHRHAALQKHLSGLTAEAGRALSQFRIKVGASPLEEYDRIVAASGGREHLEDVAQMVGAIDPQNLRQLTLFAEAATKPGRRKLLHELWISLILSGPKTHAVNLTSTWVAMLERNAEEGLTGAIDFLRARVTGTEQQRFMGESWAELYGMSQGLKDGVRAAAEAWTTETPQFGHRQVERPPAIPGRAGRVIRTPLRALLAEDEFNKAVAVRMSLHGLAYRQAAREGQTGQARITRMTELANDPSPALLEQAREEAKLRTFTQDPGAITTGFLRARQALPGSEFVAPFVVTPGNIFKFAFERSPLQPFRLAWLQAKPATRLHGGELSAELAKAVIGTTLGLGAVALAASGIITGGGPTDPRERDLLRAQGWQPYSLKVGDTYLGFGRLEPLGTIFGVGADMYELWEDLSEDQKGKMWLMLHGAVIENLSNKTFLRGLRDASRAWNDPERYGAAYLEGFGGSLVPAGVAQLARAWDPTLRRPEGLWEAVAARVPGVSETVRPSRDLWGRPVTFEGVEGISRALSPVDIRFRRDDPAAEELQRLGLTVGRPSKRLGGFELTPDEHEQYTELAGRYAQEAVTGLIDRPRYGRQDPLKQADLLREAIRESRDRARDEVLKTIPLLERRQRARETKEQRLPAGVR